MHEPGKGVPPCLDLGRGTPHPPPGPGKGVPLPPAWTWKGGTPPPPTTWTWEGVPTCPTYLDLGRGTPAPLLGPGKGVHPYTPTWTWERGTPVCTWEGVPPCMELGRWYLPPLSHRAEQTHTCENITSRRTAYAGGKKKLNKRTRNNCSIYWFGTVWRIQLQRYLRNIFFLWNHFLIKVCKNLTLVTDQLTLNVKCWKRNSSRFPIRAATLIVWKLSCTYLGKSRQCNLGFFIALELLLPIWGKTASVRFYLCQMYSICYDYQ